MHVDVCIRMWEVWGVRCVCVGICVLGEKCVGGCGRGGSGKCA